MGDLLFFFLFVYLWSLRVGVKNEIKLPGGEPTRGKDCTSLGPRIQVHQSRFTGPVEIPYVSMAHLILSSLYYRVGIL